MIFDDSDSPLTDILTGRTVEYVTRDDFGVLRIHCTDGIEVKLVAKDGHVKHAGHDVRIVVPMAAIYGQAG